MANYYDAFPDNSNMDSWLDLVYRIIIFCGIAVIVLLVFQQSRNRTEIPEKWVGDIDELTFDEVAGPETSRPVGPPPPESFD